MKGLLSIMLLTICLAASAQNLDTYDVTINKVKYTIKVGDEIHLGNGADPSGSFRFIQNGSPSEALEKQHAGQTAEVSKLRFWKVRNTYTMNIKIKGVGTYVVNIPQAFEVGEVAGVNETYFKK